MNVQRFGKGIVVLVVVLLFSLIYVGVASADYDETAKRHGYYAVLLNPAGFEPTYEVTAARHGYGRALLAAAEAVPDYGAVVARYGYGRALLAAVGAQSDYDLVAGRHGYYQALMSAGQGPLVCQLETC